MSKWVRVKDCSQTTRDKSKERERERAMKIETNTQTNKQKVNSAANEESDTRRRIYGCM